MDMSVELCLRLFSPRLPREAERPLLPDRTEAASGLLSESPLALELSSVEFLGLSVLELPGILDLRERKDREESLVSLLLIDGYDWRFPSAEFDLGDPPSGLELWLPMAAMMVEWRQSL